MHRFTMLVGILVVAAWASACGAAGDGVDAADVGAATVTTTAVSVPDIPACGASQDLYEIAVTPIRDVADRAARLTEDAALEAGRRAYPTFADGPEARLSATLVEVTIPSPAVIDPVTGEPGGVRDRLAWAVEMTGLAIPWGGSSTAREADATRENTLHTALTFIDDATGKEITTLLCP